MANPKLPKVPQLNSRLDLLHEVSIWWTEKSPHGFITDIPIGFTSDLDPKGAEFFTLWIKPDSSVVLINPKTGKQETELTEECYYQLYTYILDNRHNITPRETVMEHEPVEAKVFEREPEEVRGADDMCIGKIAVAKVEDQDDGILLSPIFISADKTWSTLTMYAVIKDNVKDSRLSKEQARQDLLAIAAAITNLAETL